MEHQSKQIETIQQLMVTMLPHFSTQAHILLPILKMSELFRTQSTPSKAKESLPIPRRQSITSTRVAPTNSLTSPPLARSYLPFNFGFEAEVIIRPKCSANQFPGLQIPSSDASHSETRRFNSTLLRVVANILSREGMAAGVYDHGDECVMDYSKWTVTTDASLSKAHIKDGFCKFISPERC